MSLARLLLDTNLLVLLIVGRIDARRIAGHRRLAGMFDHVDFALLRACIDGRRLVTCPNILTEASNLVRQTNDRHAGDYTASLADFARIATEDYIPSRQAVGHGQYHRLGLTDAVALCLADSQTQLLTIDLDLYLAAARAKHAVLNFNHYRQAKRRDFR